MSRVSRGICHQLACCLRWDALHCKQATGTWKGVHLTGWQLHVRKVLLFLLQLRWGLIRLTLVRQFLCGRVARRNIHRLLWNSLFNYLRTLITRHHLEPLLYWANTSQPSTIKVHILISDSQGILFRRPAVSFGTCLSYFYLSWASLGVLLVIHELHTARRFEVLGVVECSGHTLLECTRWLRHLSRLQLVHRFGSCHFGGVLIACHLHIFGLVSLVTQLIHCLHFIGTDAHIVISVSVLLWVKVDLISCLHFLLFTHEFFAKLLAIKRVRRERLSIFAWIKG